MRSDVLIIGAGIAGATAALELSRDRERSIVVLTREPIADGSASSWAQGGIVSRPDGDSTELLVEDVLRGGAGLSYPPAVRLLAEDGPRLVDEILIGEAGVSFDSNDAGALDFGLEGAHSRARVLHVGDATGAAIMRALLALLASKPNVQLLTGYTAVDLLTFPHHALDPLSVYESPVCHGAYALDTSTRSVRTFLARHTVLATGGLGQIFLNTTNPPGARGDGLAMAYRAQARVVNTEYVQFHPTALHTPDSTRKLISEAVRGEGARLLTPAGDPFMERYSPELGELATRDVVARAIYKEMVDHGYPHVLLDLASARTPEFIRRRFPSIHAMCLERNIDITRQPIPVVPAAHYSCGGVQVDLWGRTTLAGLYAVGEVSCTGVHGANRVASTSLLEGLVWGARAAADIRRQPPRPVLGEHEVPGWDDSGLTYEADPALIHGDLQTVRNLMWHYVGLLRNGFRLSRAMRELRSLWQNTEEFYRSAYLTDGLIGLRNMVLNAVIVARAALENPTSRGCHWREDSRPSRGAAPRPVQPIEWPE